MCEIKMSMVGDVIGIVAAICFVCILAAGTYASVRGLLKLAKGI